MDSWKDIVSYLWNHFSSHWKNRWCFVVVVVMTGLFWYRSKETPAKKINKKNSKEWDCVSIKSRERERDRVSETSRYHLCHT